VIGRRILVAVVLAAGCSSTEPLIIVRMDAVTGTELTGIVVTEVTPVPVIRVTDQRGGAVQGVRIVFHVGPEETATNTDSGLRTARVVTLDLDSDGDADLLTARSTPGFTGGPPEVVLRAWANDVSGGFTDGTKDLLGGDIPWGGARGLVYTDVNGDGARGRLRVPAGIRVRRRLQRATDLPGSAEPPAGPAGGWNGDRHGALEPESAGRWVTSTARCVTPPAYPSSNGAPLGQFRG